MIGREDKEMASGLAGSNGAQGRVDELPFSIELWNPGGGEIERVLGRALSVHLARSIFTAAQSEYPGRRITLRRSSGIVADTATA